MTFQKAFAIPLVAAASMLATGAWAATFKVAVGDAQGGTQWELATKFKQSFEQKTGGKHKLDLFPNGQLGSEEDTVNNASMGTLDFSVLAVNNVTPFSPSVGVLTLPYVIQSAEEAKTITMGEIGKELTANTVRDANVRIVGWAYSGFRVLTNSKKPVRTLADLQGLKIRVPKNEIMIATYQAWGINPTPMAWSETFTALQQRVVDGQDNPYITVAAMKFNEVQKYITNVRYVFSLEPMIVSESVFKRQPADVQKAILEAGNEASEHSYKWLMETEDKIRKDLTAMGMQIDDAANGEKEFIAKASTAVWPKFYQSIGGKDKLDKVLKTLGR
ncbi:tripartite ATP-independent transporter solute receptor, DctP family [Oryzisolibacter propanilivorax]|uniref:Tripartite ATP-independent transporter solute receptor, DctP family n=1 Tax=Oryzisolibacter propanilivorax TaxID=1527607 RepID=A0A1G9QF71_9BURK|nr:TRAP transporter substrate-binding protein [Oryzisolibacter propanilivorax]SDM08945.1 tripartite ATP-independent transporter solute receptor, DctP family [Oryzisolibacter propanilivorax]